MAQHGTRPIVDTPRLQRALAALRNESGAELLEFALSAMILLVVMFGIIDFCRAMYTYHFVSYVAQEGTRFAAVRGADWSSACSTSAPPSFTMKYACIASSADVQNYVKSLATTGVDSSSVTVATTWPGSTPNCTPSGTITCSTCATTNSKGCMVKVTVSYSFKFVALLYLPSASLNFSGTSVRVIQQ